jgi:hypothetical protein
LAPKSVSHEETFDRDLDDRRLGFAELLQERAHAVEVEVGGVVADDAEALFQEGETGLSIVAAELVAVREGVRG